VLAVGPVSAQPALVSPLPHGIVQVSHDKQTGLLRLLATSGTTVASTVLALDYRFTDSYNRAIYLPYWSGLRARNGEIDTTLRLPYFAKTFTLHYRLVTPDSIYGGEIPDLAMGHVFGVAGQSNAEGWSPPPYEPPIGDTRILRGSKFWEYGANQKRWNSPWVYMANKFRTLVPDGLPIGIVNTAVGGSSLVAWSQVGDWKRSASNPRDPLTIYGRALRMLRNAGGNMEALFWIQGESDVVSTSDSEYKAAFKELTINLESDLKHSLNFYHSQISGQIDNPGDWRPLAWGAIRNAQRDLSPSKLVATAVAYPISFDGIHYETVTMQTIGHRFAAAVADEQYGVRSVLYPPITIDQALIVDIDSERPELGKKFLLPCLQGEEPASLQMGRSFHRFELRNGEERFDTSRVFAKAHTYAAGWIEVGLKDSTILDTAGWYISYAVRADVNGADAVDTCTASSLPNALAAFLDVPVKVGSEPERPAQLKAAPPTHIPHCETRCFSLLGAEVLVSKRPVASTAELPPGVYLWVTRCGHEVSSGKLVVLPR
jgi:hypothetical protein